MVWNYHDDDVIKPALPVSVTVEGLSAATVTLTEYRIDDAHSNSYEAWKKMGSPQNPTAGQIQLLEKAGQLKTMAAPVKLKVNKGSVTIKISLPQQAVSLVKLDW
jgi:xylan 1,4-beta-xylosidase